MWKTNVLIYSKGAREIIRHYQTASHLRKDQHWTVVYLKYADKVTGIVKHEVRLKNGVVLTPLELEKERPISNKPHWMKWRRLPILR